MEDQYFSQIKDRMAKAVSVTRDDLATIRTGRATPALVENIEIIAYGGTQKLKLRELATISSADSRTLIIIPYDPEIKVDIIKGLQDARSGLMPVAGEGNEIRISIPALSEEQRQEYIKLVRAKLEAGRIMVRQVRHDEMMQLKRDFEAKLITEDDKFRTEKKIQEITDEMIAQINDIGKRKEAELMQI